MQKTNEERQTEEEEDRKYNEEDTENKITKKKGRTPTIRRKQQV